MTHPVVSICIANFNGAHLLEECIESIYKQVRAPLYEIIVYDDGSSDDSLSLLRERFPSIRVIVGEQNKGYCIANNRMACCAEGEYLLLLNNDATLFRNGLATLFKVASENPGAGILSLPQYDRDSKKLIDRGCLLDISMSPVPILEKNIQALAVIGACLWIRRSLWQQIGGFPEWFEINAEDIYLCCMVRASGSSIVVASESGYFHRQGSTLSKRSVSQAREFQSTAKRRYFSERNRAFLLLLFCGRSVIALSMVIQLPLLLAEAVGVSAFNHKPRLIYDIYLRAYLDVASKLVFLKKRRNEVQALPNASTLFSKRKLLLFPHKYSYFFKKGIPKIER